MSSIAYYDAHGDEFFARSADVEKLPHLTRFMARMPPGGVVLEAGCGSGRDALALRQAGFAVTAFDGSATMVRLASRHTGLAVLHMTFDEMAWESAFDGVWACASLLHVAPADLPAVFGRIGCALKPGGVAFASFKLGQGRRFANGRWFTDLGLDDLAALFKAAGCDILERDVSSDLRAGREHELWAAAIARRAA